MLQPHELYTEEMRRHEREALQEVEAGTPGRLVADAREMSREHPRRMRILAIVSPAP